MKALASTVTALAALFAGTSAFAAPGPAEGWVAAPVSRSLPGQDDGGGTWFHKSFGKKTGSFGALDDSMNQGPKVTGTFLVGQFRYTYRKPIGDGGYQPRHDESIDEVMLDCKAYTSATLSTTYKLKGKVVRTKAVAPSEVLFMPTGRQSTVGDLCEFARAQGALPIR